MSKHPKVNTASITAQVYLPDILVALVKASLEPRAYSRIEYLSEAKFGINEILRDIELAIRAETEGAEKPQQHHPILDLASFLRPKA